MRNKNRNEILKILFSFFFSLIRSLKSIEFADCEKILANYATYARKLDGKMTLTEFCQYLDLPPSETVNHVFELYDRDRDGKIDFREFIIGLSLLSRPASTEDTLRLSFQVSGIFVSLRYPGVAAQMQHI